MSVHVDWKSQANFQSFGKQQNGQKVDHISQYEKQKPALIPVLPSAPTTRACSSVQPAVMLSAVQTKTIVGARARVCVRVCVCVRVSAIRRPG